MEKNIQINIVWTLANRSNLIQITCKLIIITNYHFHIFMILRYERLNYLYILKKKKVNIETNVI